MSSLRIHFFTSYVHEQGTYFRYHNLARGLEQLGHRVTVFGCDVGVGAKSRQEVRDGISYEIIAESWKSSVFSQFNHPLTTLRRRLKNYPECDVGHLFQPFWGAATAWEKCRSRVRFYDWDDQWTGGLFHGPITSWRQYWPRYMTRRLEESLPRRADHVTVVGEYLAKLAAERGARSTTIVYNGFWPGPFHDRATARKLLGLRPDALYAGFMGRTLREIQWCFRGVEQNLTAYPNLRFALCGAPPEILADLPSATRERVDYLGHLAPQATRDFAAAIDLGLLPLDDTPFNRSRYPIKFCEHLASGNPLLCSEVGEVGKLSRNYSGVIPAGNTEAEWLAAFRRAISDLAAGIRPTADLTALRQTLSWEVVSERLANDYQAALAAPAARNTATAALS